MQSERQVTHIANNAHHEVASLQRALFTLLRTRPDLQLPGLNADDHQFVRNLSAEEVIAIASKGVMTVSMQLERKVDKFSHEIGHDFVVFRPELPSELMVWTQRWFGMVKEIANRSFSEAVIRFGMESNDVRHLKAMSWTEWLECLSGHSDLVLTFTIRGRGANVRRVHRMS